MVMRVDVSSWKTSQDILKNDVKSWLLNGIQCGQNSYVDSGHMRVWGFMNVFSQYYKNMLTRLIYENKHLMKLSLKIFLCLLGKRKMNYRSLQASLILLMEPVDWFSEKQKKVTLWHQNWSAGPLEMVIMLMVTRDIKKWTQSC